jgi:hypothetical protein
MSKHSDRKIQSRAYARQKPRTVRFTFARETRETLCLTDVVRDLMADRSEDQSTGWNISTLAGQIGIPVSSCHGILIGDREPNLTHLERLCALGRTSLPETLLTHVAFMTPELLERAVSSEYPFADLRLRGNLTGEQIERIGTAVERCAAQDRTEWLVRLIETAADAMTDTQRQKAPPTSLPTDFSPKSSTRK